MKSIILITLFISGIYGSIAQVAEDSELYKTFLQIDDTLFEEGFNECNLESIEDLLTDDMEFYHDIAGIQNKEEFMNAMKKNICSNPAQKPIRKLTPNTMKVFPMYNNGTLYGAIVEGKHEFYIKKAGKDLIPTGNALFSGLWIKHGDTWKLKRTYSYHHKGVK